MMELGETGGGNKSEAGTIAALRRELARVKEENDRLCNGETMALR